MEVQIQSSSGKTARLTLRENTLIEMSQKQRVQLAAKKAGIFFSLALVSVLVPVFHFVLVPLFLILTAATFFKKMKDHWKFNSLDVTCVECQATLKIDSGFDDPPFRLFCNNCHQHLQITPLSETIPASNRPHSSKSSLDPNG